MRRYKIEGNASEISSNGEIIVNDIYDNEKAPVLLKVGKKILNYLTEIGYTDEDEKYTKKRFTYCSICYVRKIEVLDKNSKVIKTITDDILGE